MTDCSIDVYDGDDVEFAHVEMRKAAKAHVCGECGRTIEPGETYEVVKLKSFGYFDTEKTCVDCLSLRETFFCSYLYHALWEHFFESFSDWWYYDLPELWKLENLTPRAREIVFQWIANHEKDDEDVQ